MDGSDTKNLIGLPGRNPPVRPCLNTDEIAHLYNSANTDTDSDGLSDAEEENLGTNLNSTDSDGDGLSDYEEVVGVHTYEKIGPTTRTWMLKKMRRVEEDILPQSLLPQNKRPYLI